MFIVFRLLTKLLTLAFALWLFLCAALFAIMWLPPSDFARQIGRIPGPAMMLMEVMPFETMWNIARGGALREGDPAPDFDLQRQDKPGRVKLSTHFGDRPVVLVFGSHTGPSLPREVPVLNKLYSEYQDRAAFYVVYIEEARASEVWRLGAACVRDLKIDLPAVVDRNDNYIERAYTAWPERLVVIDKYGRIAYKSKPGPFGFRPGDLAAALKRVSCQYAADRTAAACP